MQQQHQIYTCPVAVCKLQAEQGVHAACCARVQPALLVMLELVLAVGND
jgi:hypothetical protein